MKSSKLLRSARRVLTAVQPGLPIDRLMWLAMRRHFGENPLALVHAPADADIAQLPPADMRHAVEKIRESGCDRVCLTERGASFGYNNLVVDMRSLPIMRSFAPVIFDGTHSVQTPSAVNGVSGGQPEFIPVLTRAAVAVGVDGVFLEVHDDPPHAKSDGANALHLNYLREVLRSYFGINRIGSVAGAPVVMQLDNAHSRREPDLQVILKSNPAQKTPSALIGPADICVEVVSPESVRRDYGDKFGEYQDAGVKEYWLIDPLRSTATFYRLNEDDIYMPQSLDASGNYQTPLLPKLNVHVPTLWEEELPDIYVVTDSVRAMMKKPSE